MPRQGRSTAASSPARSRPGGRARSSAGASGPGLDTPASTAVEPDSPALRLFALLEVFAGQQRLPTLQSLVDETGLPKPTLHRMLQQLEGAGLLQRESDGRHYASGVRLRRFAETLLLNGTFHGARHRVLRALVDEVGESCNITALAGSEVVYLDRVETEAPLRFYLHPGSRVPAHCSASGKVFLARMAPEQRARLLAHAPLERYTSHTITSMKALETELDAVRRRGYATDREEFLPGLVCVAVPVPLGDGQRSNLAVALQAPAMRLPLSRALEWLPALERAAAALGHIETDALRERPRPTPAATRTAQPKRRAAAAAPRKAA